MDMVMTGDRAFFLIPIRLGTRAAQVDDRVQVVTFDNRSQCHRVELPAAVNPSWNDGMEIGLKLEKHGKRQTQNSAEAGPPDPGSTVPGKRGIIRGPGRFGHLAKLQKPRISLESGTYVSSSPLLQSFTISRQDQE